MLARMARYQSGWARGALTNIEPEGFRLRSFKMGFVLVVVTAYLRAGGYKLTIIIARNIVQPVHCRQSYHSLVAFICKSHFEDSNEPDLKRFNED